MAPEDSGTVLLWTTGGPPAGYSLCSTRNPDKGTGEGGRRQSVRISCRARPRDDGALKTLLSLSEVEPSWLPNWDSDSA